MSKGGSKPARKESPPTTDFYVGDSPYRRCLSLRSAQAGCPSGRLTLAPACRFRACSLSLRPFFARVSRNRRSNGTPSIKFAPLYPMPSPAAPITTVLLVEDEEFNRCIIQNELKRHPGWKLLGAAGDIPTAIDQLNQHSADVLMVDIGLPPPGDGFTVVAHAKKVRPQTRLLVFTSHLNEYIVAQCEKCGVHGFFNKREASTGRLGPVLGAVAAGRRYFPPEFERARADWMADSQAIAKRLTGRESEVFHLIALGLGDSEIADALAISTATAATHKSAILRKLDQPNIVKLTVYAIKHGYGRLSC